MKTVLATLLVACAAVAVYTARAEEDKKVENRVFELRIYYVHPGRMDAMLARFRNHTTKLFEKHGMTNVGYWVETDPKDKQDKLIYVLAFPSKEAADKSWQGFREDETWKKVRAESEKDGPIVMKVESRYMAPADFSKIK